MQNDVLIKWHPLCVRQRLHVHITGLSEVQDSGYPTALALFLGMTWKFDMVNRMNIDLHV